MTVVVGIICVLIGYVLALMMDKNVDNLMSELTRDKASNKDTYIDYNGHEYVIRVVSIR